MLTTRRRFQEDGERRPESAPVGCVRGIVWHSSTCRAPRSSGGAVGRYSCPLRPRATPVRRRARPRTRVWKPGRRRRRRTAERRTCASLIVSERRRRHRRCLYWPDKRAGSCDSTDACAQGMVGQQYRELEVVLRRDSPATPWGFRLQGGAECQAPLTVQRVSRICSDHSSHLM